MDVAKKLVLFVFIIAHRMLGRRHFSSALALMWSNRAADQQDQSATVAEFQRMLLGRFRPELLNRFDEIVPFFPLSRQRIRELANEIVQDS